MTIDEIIDEALKEDIGDGDITSLAIFPGEARSKAQLKIKDEGVLAGVPLAEKIFMKVDPGLKTEVFIRDGTHVSYGDIVLTVKGSTISILAAERLVLNFMQRLSGIATATAKVVARLEGLHTRVLDTRKTTPNLRELEKYAVRMGGGVNHRIGLYDMVLIKDNHVDMAGGIVPAIMAARKYLTDTRKPDIKIEIEVRNSRELDEALAYGQVDRIMLDNYTPESLRDAVKRVNGKFETEASGGITIENVREYAESGVDFISVGALTHNFRSLDMNLKMIT